MRPLNDHGASEWTDVYQVSSGIQQYHPHRFPTVSDERTRMDWLVSVWFIFGVFLLDFFLTRSIVYGAICSSGCLCIFCILLLKQD